MSDKQALEALQRGEQLNNQMLAHLRRQGLIEVQDVSNLDTATGERDLLFTFFTEAGRKLLEN